MKWWKILAILILIYVHIAGLLIPIGVGIQSVSPFQVRAGDDVHLKVTTYNAILDNAVADEVRAWLKFDDDHLIRAEEVSILENDQLDLGFAMPTTLPGDKKTGDLTLIIDIPEQGTPVSPRAVFVNTEGAENASSAQWADIDLSDLNVVTKMHFPYRSILLESIRNTYFHVSLWLAMMILLTGAVVLSIIYLRKQTLLSDSRASALTEIGFLFGILGLVTGMIWAKYTWGRAWSWDIKQVTTGIALLIYAAYFLLRRSVRDPYKKAQLSAVFNIFAYIALIPLLYIIPRMSDSLHPGSGGNPALGGEDLDSTMRMVFYPAVIGWALAGLWMADVLSRIKQIRIITKFQ